MKQKLKVIYHWFIEHYAVLIVGLLWGDVWALRRSEKSSHSGFKEKLYYAYLQHYGSWIGLGATFEATPVFPHGINGIFISNRARIGRGVVIFHQVTIGSNTLPGSRNGSPTIEDNVYIGCGAKIIGEVSVGRNARIGANCVVVKSVPANSVTVIRGVETLVKDHDLDNSWVRVDA